MDQNSIYNYTKEFKTECLQPIVKIKQFCLSHGIPFYMTFATANDDQDTEYITSKQLPPECSTELHDDKFRKIILAEHGFDLLINHVDTFSMDDVCDAILSIPSNDLPSTNGNQEN
jgi:hypothetical protein